MTDSVARRVALSGTAILVVTLVAVGAGTGVALYRHQVSSLDRTLLAVAHAEAHPQSPVGWEVEHARSPVRAWTVHPGDRRVPAAALREVSRRERPVYLDTGSKRMVLVPVDIEGETEQEAAVAATAPRVTVAGSVGPFALAYALLGVLAAAIAAFAQAGVVRRAFRPLERTRHEAARVVALGQGQRLTEGGPVEIRSLIEAINALLDRLENAYEAQGRFTAEAAHELRTPVAAMLGELDVALRHPRGAEETRTVLVSTREEVARLARLVQGLTALARLDAGQAEGPRDLVRAEECARTAVASEQEALARAGCPVRVVVEQDPELQVHRSLLEVALGNLVRNAARHAPGAEVVVRVGARGDLAVFEVDDGGPGLPEAEQEAVFDRFARTGEARRRDRAGLGLGLPLAREVARRHGGDCTLHPSERGGLLARLTVRKPAK